MYLSLRFLTLGLLFSLSLSAQSELVIESGLQHLRILDRHASPLIYQSTAPGFSLVFRKEKPNSFLSTRANLMISQLEPANGSLFRYDFKGTKNTIAAGFVIDYLRKNDAEKTLWWGGSLNYSALIDFEGVANFPWATLYGDLGLKVRKDFSIGDKFRLQGEVGLPVIGLVTRQPYNFIPRREGEEPGVPSLFVLGTKVVTWNKYQRLDMGISGSIKLGDRWLLRPAYRLHWARYTAPKTIQLYRQKLVLGVSYKL